MKLPLDSTVKVKLTPRGEAIVNYQLKLLARPTHEPKRIKPDKSGMVEFTLAALMDVFGPYILAGEALFQDATVHLPDKNEAGA